MERDTRDLPEIAERLVKAWQEYRESTEWLRFSWGPSKFFSEGHWQNSASWPYDDDRIRSVREA
jgi:hypothetical protein